jgi:type IV secretion system protein VirB9
MKWLAFLCAILAAPIAAQVRPTPGQGDQRLQNVRYDAEQVVQLPVAPGFQLMVSLAPGERIETIAVGDSSAWQVTASKRGDVFFVKNVQATNMTNMTVISDARTYSFELIPSGGYGGDTTYSVKFTYSDPVEAIAEAEEAPQYRYKLSGARAIRPLHVFPQGNQTIIEWSPEQQQPAIFEMRQGDEILINGEMQDGRYVVVGNPKKLIFRLDRLVATAVRTTPRKVRK